MQPYQIRRAAIILLGIILIVFVVVQGVRIAANIGGGDSEAPATTSELTLPEYANIDSSVRLTYSGSIVARENYHQIRMSVSDSGRTLEIIRGYGNKVIKRQRLNNTQEAYQVFLRTLYLNDFANAQDNELGDEASGVCFRGDRIVGQVFESGQQVQSLWAASCDKDFGTMDAKWRDVLKLFEDQFPDYRDFTRDFRF